MTIGDRVKLHTKTDDTAAIELSANIGVIVDLDPSPNEDYVLIHFDDVTVYISPVKEGEVEVIPGP